MPLIIDAWNVLHTVGVLPPEFAEHGGDLEGLVRLLAASRYRDERIELVCDGSPQRKGSGHRAQGTGVRGPSAADSGPADDDEARVVTTQSRMSNLNIRFSGPGREADEVIAMLVRHSTAPRHLTVVTSDAAVLKVARRRKCRTLTSQEFLHQLASDAAASGAVARPPALKPPGGLSDEQVKAWLEVFGVDEAQPEAAADEESATIAPDATASDQDDRSRGRRSPVVPPSVIREAERLWSKGKREA